jgi:hypothetical protein
MSRVAGKFLERLLSGIADLRRQFVIQPPEFGCAARNHFLFRSDLSLSVKKPSGFCRYPASSLSRSELRAGRGEASFKIAPQPSAGNASGHNAGMSCISWRRAFDGNLAMAFSISSNDLMQGKCASFASVSMTSTNGTISFPPRQSKPAALQIQRFNLRPIQKCPRFSI